MPRIGDYHRLHQWIICCCELFARLDGLHVANDICEPDRAGFILTGFSAFPIIVVLAFQFNRVNLAMRYAPDYIHVALTSLAQHFSLHAHQCMWQ